MKISSYEWNSSVIITMSKAIPSDPMGQNINIGVYSMSTTLVQVAGEPMSSMGKM